MDRIQKTTTRSAAPTTEDVTTMSSNAANVAVDKTEYNAIVYASYNPRKQRR